MKKLNFIYLFAGLLIGIFIHSAAVAPHSNNASISKIASLEVLQAVKNNQLGQLVEETTGKKLSFKERVALKLFGKKIQTISKTQTNKQTQGGKSQLVAILLAAIFGLVIPIFGIHRFYLGYVWQGVLQILTFGFCGIWWLIDLIRMATGDLKPINGDYTS
jgi:TM2 domain-containing membrane protein YozV